MWVYVNPAPGIRWCSVGPWTNVGLNRPKYSWLETELGPQGKRGRRGEMRGVGGPLLTIGDLLSDLAVDGGADLAGGEVSVPSSPSSAGQQAEEADPSELNRLFGVRAPFLFFPLLPVPRFGRHQSIDSSYHMRFSSLIMHPSCNWFDFLSYLLGAGIFWLSRWRINGPDTVYEIEEIVYSTFRRA